MSSVFRPSVHNYFVWCNISCISVILGTNIQHCWKGFQGQRSEVKIMTWPINLQRLQWQRHTFQLCGFEADFFVFYVFYEIYQQFKWPAQLSVTYSDLTWYIACRFEQRAWTEWWSSGAQNAYISQDWVPRWYRKLCSHTIVWWGRWWQQCHGTNRLKVRHWKPGICSRRHQHDKWLGSGEESMFERCGKCETSPANWQCNQWQSRSVSKREFSETAKALPDLW